MTVRHPRARAGLGLVLVLVACASMVACGGGSPAAPAAPAVSPTPTPTPGPPQPSGATSGRIADLQAAADIVLYNQDAVAGSSFRRRDTISRWELPVPVNVDASILSTNVEQALQYWQSLTGLTYTLREGSEPRVFVRAGTDGLPGVTGRAVIDGVFPDNRARSALIVIHPDLARCAFTETRCAVVFKHEIGHVLGMLDHVAGGGLMSGGAAASPRETAMLLELYRLPHGARVSADGSWQVR